MTTLSIFYLNFFFFVLLYIVSVSYTFCVCLSYCFQSFVCFYHWIPRLAGVIKEEKSP